MKYIFITGGVTSSLGKGILSASIGALLQSKGYKVRNKKMDPYLNVDPGTMRPSEHGEVFVTNDGAETDLDLGHYERFTGNFTNKNDSISAGRIYSNVLERERRGDYLGSTIQVIPHVTNEIKAFITNDLTDEDFVICEIGGTVGDIEATPFIEAVRQFINEHNKVGQQKRALSIHLTLIPYLNVVGENKTKPTQHSVRELQSMGIKPDIIVCRAEQEISKTDLDKIALFCNVDVLDVIPAYNISSIYKIPLAYSKQGLDDRIEINFNLPKKQKNINKWQDLELKIDNLKDSVNIAFIVKYFTLQDSYKSIVEAFNHASLNANIKVNLVWIDSSKLENPDVNLQEIFKGCQGIMVGPGFGERGAEGKIRAATYARENNIPYFGICFGMQLAVIEFARSVLGIADATSSEFGPNGTPVVGLITQWQKDGVEQVRDEKSNKGGTMRLGSYPCVISPNTLTSKIYGGATEIKERHRHRYEINTKYIKQFEEKGMIFSGMSPDGKLPEMVEIKGHPWFVGVQFHPELMSQVFTPRPLFIDFIKASLDYKNK
jgi:CTP synthase